MDYHVSNPSRPDLLHPEKLIGWILLNPLQRLVELWFSANVVARSLVRTAPANPLCLRTCCPTWLAHAGSANAEGGISELTSPLQSDDASNSRRARLAVVLQLRAAEPSSLVIPWSKLQRGDLLVLDGYETTQLSAARCDRNAMQLSAHRPACHQSSTNDASDALRIERLVLQSRGALSINC